MDKREQHRAMLKEIAAGSVRFVFYSRKLKDDQPRNCQFCGELFLPGQQPGLETPFGPVHWRRTLCSDECQGFRYELRRRKLRSGAIKNGRTPGVVVDLNAIRERDKFICYLCGGQTERGYKGSDTRLKPEVDHIIPLLRSGKHHPDNMRCCCGRCNLGKGNMTLQEQIEMYSDGEIDFDDKRKYPEPPALEEIILIWRKYVLPSVKENSMYKN